MAINPLYNSSTIRLMGMASGIDTESIIKQTMKIHQLKIDSRLRSRTLLEWKQKMLSGIGDELTDFRRTYLTMLGASAMRVSSAYNTNVAEVIGKNAGAVTIGTTVNSPLGSIKIGQIERLAKNTSVTTVGTASRDGAGFKPTDKLYSLSLTGSKIEFDSSGKARVNINGADMILDKDQGLGLVVFDPNEAPPLDGLDDYATVPGVNVNIQINGGYQIAFDQTDSRGDYAIVNVNGKKVQLYKDEAFETDGVTQKMGLGQLLADKAGPIERSFNFDQYGRFTVGVNGVNITLNKDMSISEMMDTVNNSGAGVTMRYDQFADQFTIESNAIGASNMVVWGFESLGIGTGVYNNGQTARVQINGEWVERPRNDFDYRGVTITLNYETKGSGVGGVWDEGADDITVSIRRDVTEPLERIKAFIESYNTIISKLEGLIKETKNASERTYTPLTDEEKSVMSEKQIEEWEAIAKKGILRNDSGLQSLTLSLRAALFEQVEAAGLTPSQIGLTTGRYSDNTGGQIILDEEKLKAALESDPTRVMNVFMGGSDSTSATGRGFLWRMDDIMSNYVNGSQFASISNLESSIIRTNEQMEKLQQKMWEAEDKLYKQFAAMETALAKIQSQGDWLTAMLSSMNGSKQ